MNRPATAALALFLAAAPLRGGPAPSEIPADVRRRLGDADPKVRSQGLKALKGRMDGDAVLAVLPLLDDRDSYCRDYASVVLLGRVKDPATVGVIAERAPRAGTREGRRAAADALLSIGMPETLPGLLQLSGDRDACTRRTALDGIGRVGDPADVATGVALRTSFGDPDEGVRAAALEAALLLGIPEAPEALAKALEDRGAGVRTAAATLLASRDPEGFEAALPKLAADPDWGVRLVAARSARELRKNPPVEVLAGLLEDGRMRVADAAHDSLRTLSGLEFPPLKEDWLRWWEGAKAKWQEGSGRRFRALDRPTVATYHGLPFRSDAILFVVDLSGSMTEPLGAIDSRTRLEVAREELARTLHALPDATEADLMTFMVDRARALGKLQPLGGATRAKITRWFERRQAGSRGDLGGALLEALADPEADTVILLGDGDSSAGEMLFRERIRERVRQSLRLRPMAIHAVAYGSDPGDRLFLEEISGLTGGRCVER